MTNLHPIHSYPARDSAFMPASGARKFLYGIAGRALLIEALDEWSALAVSKQFEGWFLTPLAVSETTHADSTIRIRCGSIPPPIPRGLDRFDVSDGGVCHTDGQTLYLELDGSLIIIGSICQPRVDVWIRKPYDSSSWILAQVISQAFAAALRRCGLFLLHSAGLVPPWQDKALIIAGESGCGKSTLALQLAMCGWSYLSDDSLVLGKDHGKTQVQGLRRSFALTSATLTANRLPYLPEHASSASFIKKRLNPQESFPQRQIKAANPGVVLFPVITHEPESRIHRLTRYETTTRLLKLSPWACYDKPTASRYVDVLGSFVRETIAFDLFAGKDLLGKPTGTADLISTAYAGSR